MQRGRKTPWPSSGVMLAALAFHAGTILADETPPGPSRTIVINEICAANRSLILDEDGRSSDWIELLNTSAAAVDLKGFTLSDDAAKPAKWAFPGIIVPPGGRLLVWASGKDRSVIPTKTLSKGRLAVPFERTIIRLGETWRYLLPEVDRTEVPASWSAVDFDDSSWPRGPSGFGYNDNDDATLVPEGTTIVLLRKKFRLDSAGLTDQVLLKVDYDDGFVAYLNGVQISSVNAPEKIDSHAQATNKHSMGQAEYFDLTPHIGLLRPGENVLAIAALNTKPSGDMSLLPELGTLSRVCHTSFELKAEQGELLLSDPAAHVVDRIAYTRQPEDRTSGRSPDGVGEWSHFATPSPREPNNFRSFVEPPEATLSLSPPPGFQPGRYEVKVNVATKLQGVELHYTVDGADPTAQNRRTDGTLRMTRTLVLRVAAFIGEERVSPIITGSYFVGAPPAIHVVSIGMSRKDFSTVHLVQGAHGRTSERAAHIDIFDTRGALVTSSGVGFRLHGGYGRSGNLTTKKSYKLYFRNMYGDAELGHELIAGVAGKKLDRVVLRANFNDRLGAYQPASTDLRDEVLRKLHRDMGAVISSGDWCLLYVNGEARGLYNVVERIDEGFLKRHFGGKDWDLLKTGEAVVCGTRDNWDVLKKLLVKPDFSNPATFEKLKACVDVPSFTAYVILNLWSQNEDWPQNNWYAARERREGARWFFLCWDAEWGMGHTPAGWTAPSFETFFKKKAVIRDLLAALFKDPEYRKTFKAEVERYLAGALSPENVSKRVSEEEARVAPFMPLELRVNAPGFSESSWRGNVEFLRTFGAQRKAVFLQLTQQALSNL